MRTITLSMVFLCLSFFTRLKGYADEQERVVDSFSEISLRVSGKLYLSQGDKQYIEIVAKASTLDEIITEVKDGKLIIRFPNRNYLWKDFDAGKIVIYITVPEINGLSISGSGDIIAEDEIDTRILDLAVSGSGDISLMELKADRVKVAVSGSGDVLLVGTEIASDLSGSISGSGNLKALDFPAKDALLKVSGSGDCSVHVMDHLTVKVVGSANVRYRGNPLVDKTVVGSGSVNNIN